jgi:hypothetical protein
LRNYFYNKLGKQEPRIYHKEGNNACKIWKEIRLAFPGANLIKKLNGLSNEIPKHTILRHLSVVSMMVDKSVFGITKFKRP